MEHSQLHHQADVRTLTKKAKVLRKHIVNMIFEAGSGHPGGSLSCIDILTALYFSELHHDPSKPAWPDRDRFILSKGHAAPALYSALAESGYFPVEILHTLRKMGSMLQGHPDTKIPGVEVSTGSLGQGLSVACGCALAARIDGRCFRTYVMLGDGECDEGQIWEAAIFGSHHKLDSLVAIVDRNGLQIDGPTEQVLRLEPLAGKWREFGWHVIEIDGNKIPDILHAFSEAKKVKGKPTVIIAHTLKGKGVSFMEWIGSFHGKALNKDEMKIALDELERD